MIDIQTTIQIYPIGVFDLISLRKIIMAKTKAQKTIVVNRLNRISGQINGVKRMIESDRECTDIITQMSAIRAAVGQLGALMVQGHMEECLQRAIKEGRSKELVMTLNKIMKQMLR